MRLGDFDINEIYNLDSYEAIKRLPDKCIDLVNIDPPYLFRGTYGIKSRTRNLNKLQKIRNLSEINKSAIKLQNELRQKGLNVGIDNSILYEIVRVMKRINCYIWCNKQLIPQLMKFFIEEQNCLFEIEVWCKTNVIPAINNTFLPDIEYCLYFRERGVKLQGDYHCRHKFWVSSTNMADKKLYKHPTIKPLNIIKEQILAATQEGDLVADFFIGSGTTAVAAIEIKRNYIGFELDKEFYEIARRRINEKLTSD